MLEYSNGIAQRNNRVLEDSLFTYAMTVFRHKNAQMGNNQLQFSMIAFSLQRPCNTVSMMQELFSRRLHRPEHSRMGMAETVNVRSARCFRLVDDVRGSAIYTLVDDVYGSAIYTDKQCLYSNYGPFIAWT